MDRNQGESMMKAGMAIRGEFRCYRLMDWKTGLQQRGVLDARGSSPDFLAASPVRESNEQLIDAALAIACVAGCALMGWAGAVWL